MKVRDEFSRRASPETAPPTNVAAPVRAARAPRPGAGRRRSGAITALLLGAIWAGLHWGDPAAWIIGVPVMLGGGLVAMRLPAAPPPRLSPLGTARFAAFAAAGILRGAWDVSLRSLRPSRISPGCLRWRTRLPEGRPRRLFALSISLLPGTLTAGLEDDLLTVHALDLTPATRDELDALERKIAGLYGLTLEGDAP